MSMGLSKQDKLWKNVILPLIGTGGIGAIIIALLNHGGGHNVTTGNVSGNVAIGDHATIQIGVSQSTSNQPNVKLESNSLTPIQIIAEIQSARPAVREAVKESFRGAVVDWSLRLHDISNDEDNTNFLIVMTYDGNFDRSDFASVKVIVKKSQLSELSLLPNDSKVRVRGTIFDADEIGIGVWKASVTQSQ